MKRILFIDDEFSPECDTDEGFGSYMSLYALELTDEGYSVTRLRSIDDAWTELQLNRYDLIIVDLMMPPGNLLRDVDTHDGVISGYQFAKKVKERWPSAKMILLSAAADSNQENLWHTELGVDTVLHKQDITPELLYKRVSELLRK
jgi:CheY-like chemotaxis protein